MRFGNRRYWLFQGIGWGAFVLINVFFNWSFDQLETEEQKRLVFGRLGLFVVLGLAISHMMRLAIIRWNILQKKLEKQILQFLILTTVFSLIGSIIDISIKNSFFRHRFNDISLKEVGNSLHRAWKRMETRVKKYRPCTARGCCHYQKNHHVRWATRR